MPAIDSRGRRALLVALGLILAVNLWVGLRLPVLIQDGSLAELLELERRIEAFPHKEAVRILILGNSHAVAALRPPVLAARLGVPPEAIFNLASFGISVYTARLIAERYLDRFPHAELALVGTDAYFLGSENEVRLRYLTRFDPPARWAIARRSPSLDSRLSALMLLPFPLADFNGPLLDATAHPARLARRLAFPGWQPTPKNGAIAHIPYPWGFPPIWDTPALNDMAEIRREWRFPKFMLERADLMLVGVDRVGAQLDEYDTLLRLLERHGLAVQLVEMPYDRHFRFILTHHRRKAYAIYRTALAVYLRRSGRTLVPAPNLPDDCFYELDHASPRGAVRMAALLSPLLRGRAR